MIRKALLALLPVLAVACVAPEEDDAAQAGTDALSQEKETVFAGTDGSDKVEISFRFEGAPGKRAALARFRRGAATADLECSQKMKIDLAPAADSISTTCVQSGSNAVGFYVSYTPSTKRFYVGSFADRTKPLTSTERELDRILAADDGRKHRELAVKSKSLATDPLTDPIAFGNAVHGNLRTAIGLSVVDRRPGHSVADGNYTIELIEAATNFGPLESTLVVHGPEKGPANEISWHNGQSITVPLLKAPGKLASEEDSRLAILAKLRQL